MLLSPSVHAQESIPTEVKSLSEAMLKAYKSSDYKVFIAQFARKPKEAAGEKLLKKKFLRRAKKLQSEHINFKLDSKVAGYRTFDSPMQQKFYPNIDRFYLISYTYSQPNAYGGTTNSFIDLKYINDQGTWYLIN